MKHNRIIWIDWAKAIGIFFVLWGHKEPFWELKSYFFSFHIPLFFFISGYLNKQKNLKLTFINYACKYAYSLLIPYFVLGLVSYVIWSIKGYIHPPRGVELIPLWRPLIGMLYGTSFNPANLRHSLPMWFLPALFSTHLIHYLLRKVFYKNLFYIIAASCTFLLGLLSLNLLPYRLPFGIENAFFGILFYSVGNVLHRKQWSGFSQYNIQFVITLLTLLSLQLYGIYLNGSEVDIRSGDFNNPYCYIITAFSGIFFWIFLSSKLPSSKIAEGISRNTIVMFTLQSTFHLIFSFILYFFKVHDAAFVKTPIMGLITTIFALICLYLFSEACRNYFPIAIGEKNIH